ncbi:MAG: prepilin-type N-terminal cleavage/methylation domain-containing protein [Planctomycetes bacterium]|nr:prepilin-type N-terminal cleavage/methylation domain-containing protein [Planctomycetota bacterium]
MRSITSYRQKSFRLAAGFTLVELVIVVLVLGILGTVAASRATYSIQDSIRVTLQSNLDALYNAVDLNRRSAYPAAIEPEWFRGSRLPPHPQADTAAATVQVATDAGLSDPVNKVLVGALAPYWYNSQNGEIRVRVGIVGTEAETLAFYNLVNGTSVTSLGNYVAVAKANGGGGK